MIRTRLAFVLLALFGLVGLAGCGDSSSTGGSATTTVPPAALNGNVWTLDSFQTQTATVQAAATPVATLEFGDAGAFTGSTGCNRMSGTYTVDGASLSITIGPMTQAACTSVALTAQETALTTLLPKVSAFSIDGETLTLEDQGGELLLTYKVGLSELEGTSWTASGVNNGTGGVESTALTETLTADFGADGAFSGFGGCNSLSGTYTVTDPDGLAISGLVSTKKSCGTDVDTLEGQYIAALGNVATYAIAGDELTLRDSGGATQVTYRLAG